MISPYGDEVFLMRAWYERRQEKLFIPFSEMRLFSKSLFAKIIFVFGRFEKSFSTKIDPFVVTV
ncbi:MAG: hypothetical protein ABF429_05130 [Zymomonas mobilis]|uniref:hypothetical protein n=1 Tax=Zymomonas mobilis TaxID=542 RepID=UPI0001B707D6|nr:hypothetical protein Za10_1096 [Zymomonas mobilis subsp. mobilis NCIMB 11163]ART93557.1 hypothetical protein B9T50_05180 [Zymomonas mobilis subsp. mobilis]TWD60270.1 hypothetical protein FBY50_1087 [Zymomonas mobilis]